MAVRLDPLYGRGEGPEDLVDALVGYRMQIVGGQGEF